MPKGGIIEDGKYKLHGSARSPRAFPQRNSYLAAFECYKLTPLQDGGRKSFHDQKYPNKRPNSLR